MDIGRKTRSFPAGIRRILVARDRGCAFPGCARPPRHCDGHHIHHWAEGGRTSVDNAVLLCRHHHTL
ncbi:HNH endonuclease signature motif containing protein, partial [Lentzea aerocolonigenes]|uniref:HNH endonuclease signature motif containing protein n=1 Tax=Lentzea aerocolonigenes TaxID=68170 RepID=UPI001E542862